MPAGHADEAHAPPPGLQLLGHGERREDVAARAAAGEEDVEGSVGVAIASVIHRQACCDTLSSTPQMHRVTTSDEPP